MCALGLLFLPESSANPVTNANLTGAPVDPVKGTDEPTVERASAHELISDQATWKELSLVDDCEQGGLPNTCCPYWKVKVVWGFTGPTVTCETGGNFKCKEKGCDEISEEENCGGL